MVSSETIDNKIDFIEQVNSKKSKRDLSLRDKIKSQEWFFSFSNKLPPDWIEVNFMDITWLITCGVAKRPTYVNEGVPFLSAQNARPFKTNLDKIRFISEKEFKQLTVGGKPEKNDILYTRVGNCGEAAKIKYDFDFGIYVSLTLIKPIHELVDSDYLVAFLNGYYGRQQANVGAIGIGLKNLNVDNVRKFRIPLPPLKTQQQIVSKIEELFSELDKGIEELKTAQQQLKVYRQAVLKWAFEGKLTNEDVKDGELPEGWRLSVLGNYIKHIGAGKSFRCEERPPKANEVGILKVSSVTWGYYDEEESKTCYSNDLLNEIYLVREGDFLFSRANTLELIGACVIVQSVSKTLMLSDKILRFSFSDEVSKKYVLYYLRSRKGRREIERLSTGNQESMRNIGQEKIRQITMPITNLEEQQQIVQEIESRLSVCDKIEETITDSLKQAEALRQSILKKAFEGKLK
jgi:type I restriction enzyme S subunit